MFSTRRQFLFAPVVGLILAAACPAQSSDEVPSFKKRPTEEKSFVTKAGAAVIHAARSKPQKIGLVEYKFESPKPNRKELTVKMEYYGLISMKRFVSDIVFIIDTTDKDSWEVLNIKYSDNNPNVVGPNEKKIQELIKSFNK